jgi:hypothetical protein
MSANEQLYVTSAREHGAATLKGDSAATNRAYYNLIQALRGLRGSRDRGVLFLTSLLNDADPAVVAWAATHLLPFKEKEACLALEEIAKRGIRLISLDAEMTLEEWRSGRLKVE